jgi:hypothetical protein
MFGGIFDSLRSVGDDISGFFDTSLGQAVAKGGKALFETNTERMRPSLTENFVGVGGGNFNSTETKETKSNDFSATEVAWLNRLNRFRSMVKETEVKK